MAAARGRMSETRIAGRSRCRPRRGPVAAMGCRVRDGVPVAVPGRVMARGLGVGPALFRNFPRTPPTPILTRKSPFECAGLPGAAPGLSRSCLGLVPDLWGRRSRYQCIGSLTRMVDTNMSGTRGQHATVLGVGYSEICGHCCCKVLAFAKPGGIAGHTADVVVEAAAQ